MAPSTSVCHAINLSVIVLFIVLLSIIVNSVLDILLRDLFRLLNNLTLLALLTWGTLIDIVLFSTILSAGTSTIGSFLRNPLSVLHVSLLESSPSHLSCLLVDALFSSNALPVDSLLGQVKLALREDLLDDGKDEVVVIPEGVRSTMLLC